VAPILVNFPENQLIKQHCWATPKFGHHNGMEDVLQGCGDACGSFCTAY